LGFLNTFLYQNSQAFTDITKGNDKVGRMGEPLEYGYDCAKGWDPVTGLGTPDFTKLLASVLAVPQGKALQRLEKVIGQKKGLSMLGPRGSSNEVLVKLHDGYFRGPLEEVDVGSFLQADARKVEL